MPSNLVPRESATTAVLVLGGLGIVGFLIYNYYNKKLQPVGGIKGATDAAGAVSQISSGINTLASPLKKLWADFMSPQGAGSAIDPNNPTKIGSPGQFSQNNNGVPSWLNTTNAAVNTANGAFNLISQSFNLTR